MKFHVFYTDNIPKLIPEQHKQCCDKLKIKVEYSVIPYEKDFLTRYYQHGEFLNWTMNNSSSETVCFMDLDCLPYDKNILEKVYTWVNETQSFCGNAQNISHTALRNQIYAAPSMLMIHKKAYQDLDCPDLKCVYENNLTQIDTAQILTIRANQIGYNYQLLYPIGYDGPETYSLGGYGNYGVGTLYAGTYHYFALSENLESLSKLWNQRVNNILNQESIIPRYKSRFYDL
jgi:hypothetical protein